MDGVIVLAGMCISAMLPFALLTFLIRKGLSGPALTMLSVLGGVFAVLIYAAARPFGIDPVLAMSLALLFVLPALMGGGAGALLGWILRRRDDRMSRSPK